MKNKKLLYVAKFLDASYVFTFYKKMLTFHPILMTLLNTVCKIQNLLQNVYSSEFHFDFCLLRTYLFQGHVWCREV